jgi:hypothetical protein
VTLRAATAPRGGASHNARDMGYPDIDLARRQQAALRRVIDEHGGGADPRRLRRALALCQELGATIDDEYCRRKLLSLEECAAELLSGPEPRARGALTGGEFLRRKIREALELLLSRLYSLEQARRFGEARLPGVRVPRLAG